MCTDTTEIVEDYLEKADKLLKDLDRPRDLDSILKVARFIYDIDNNVDKKEEYTEAQRELNSNLDRLLMSIDEIKNDFYKLLLK